jgi:1-aminocyclopropane-1-carboxylate deaminase/D-cysteine desulfhydrase-like pyridoxal-dependent ACC family enzyme
MKIDIQEVIRSCFESCESVLVKNTRIHLIEKYNENRIFLKREDETGFGISGYKLRKYWSLLPFLRKEKFDLVLVAGGSHSNNVLALAQILKENGIGMKAYLRGESHLPLKGNHFLIRLLLKEQELEYIPRNEWSGYKEKIDNDAEQFRKSGKKVFILPEGAATRAAVPGIMTLFFDILYNEKNEGVEFDSILIDAGTGFTAVVLLFANALLLVPKKIHILSQAASENEIEEMIVKVSEWLLQLSGAKWPKPQNYSVHIPRSNKKFGLPDQEILTFIRSFASEKGVLTDPVYSGPFIFEALKLIHSGELETGKATLMVHSGGGTSLLGYSDKFTV